ncbi:MAG: hypothetical protein WCA10_21390 [Terracidiphilus sp.]
MRSLITCFNALFLGLILGMIFVAIFDAPPPDRQETVRHSGSVLQSLVIHRFDRECGQWSSAHVRFGPLRKRGSRLLSCQ